MGLSSRLILHMSLEDNMTAEERENIIQESVERVLLLIPETIGNIMKSNAMYYEMNKGFFNSNPEFKEHIDIVQAAIQSTESNNPAKDYSSILKDAEKLIREQINVKQALSLKNNNWKDLDLSVPDNGAI